MTSLHEACTHVPGGCVMAAVAARILNTHFVNIVKISLLPSFMHAYPVEPPQLVHLKTS